MAEITAACCTRPASDVTVLIDYYQRGSKFIMLEVRFRFGVWKDLPWKAICLARPDAFAKYDRIDQDPQIHHRLTTRLLASDSASRAELERVAPGAPLQ